MNRLPLRPVAAQQAVGAIGHVPGPFLRTAAYPILRSFSISSAVFASASTRDERPGDSLLFSSFPVTMPLIEVAVLLNGSYRSWVFGRHGAKPNQAMRSARDKEPVPYTSSRDRGIRSLQRAHHFFLERFTATLWICKSIARRDVARLQTAPEPLSALGG